jgi:hypothetical protein
MRIRSLQSRRAALAATLTLAALAALAPVAVAQSIWLDRVSPKTLHLEIAKPLYEDAEDVDFMTANWSLSGRFPIGATLHIVGELPYARIGFNSDFADESSTTIGNLYAGIETHVAEGNGAWFEAGVRVPTASEADENDEDNAATLTGTFVDVDRWEAYGLATDAFILHTAVHGRTDPVGKIGVDVRLAPNLWLGNELFGEGSDDAELFLVFGAQVLYHGTSVRAGAGITGRTFVTEDEGGTSAHQVEAAFDVLSGRVRPGMTLRVPINEYDFIEKDAVIGISLNVLLD